MTEVYDVLVQRHASAPKEHATILFSYSTPVAADIEDKLYKTSKKHSVTTSKHINKWIGSMNAQEMPQEFFDHLL